jgi:hypothetical protein
MNISKIEKIHQCSRIKGSIKGINVEILIADTSKYTGDVIRIHMGEIKQENVHDPVIAAIRTAEFLKEFGDELIEMAKKSAQLNGVFKND